MDYSQVTRNIAFEEKKRILLQTGTLFEDPEFPCNDSALGSDLYKFSVIWKRPTEMNANPVFVTKNCNERFDVNQGYLGNCWLLAGISSLTAHEEMFDRVVHTDQSFQKQYCGIFRFTFWSFGHWTDVIIDDRLPTYGDKLFFNKSQPGGFWAPLIEKAFAKYYGNYTVLRGGLVNEVFEDLTGGICESFKWNPTEPPMPNFLQYILDNIHMCSLMSAAIHFGPPSQNGLVQKHSYSINAVRAVQSRNPTTGKMEQVYLIRLRNPWGQRTEWNGDWSDTSEKWATVCEGTRDQMKLKNHADGEFWMSYEDFLNNFNRMQVCHLIYPDNSTSLIMADKSNWFFSEFHSRWVRGATAGGAFILQNKETFPMNRQYEIKLHSETGLAVTVLIAVTQKNRRKQHKSQLAIGYCGFAVNCLNPGQNNSLGPEFFQQFEEPTFRVNKFSNSRQSYGRHLLNSDETYCIVPSTLSSNGETEYMIRVFANGQINMRELDGEGVRVFENAQENIFKGGNKQEIDIDPYLNQSFTILSGKTGEEALGASLNDEKLLEFFNTVASDITASTSTSAPGNNLKMQFTLETCRALIKYVDINQDHLGKLDIDNFRTVCKHLKLLKFVSERYLIKDPIEGGRVGHMKPFSLKKALLDAGYQVTRDILDDLMMYHGQRDGTLLPDDFVQCVIKVQKIADSQ